MSRKLTTLFTMVAMLALATAATAGQYFEMESTTDSYQMAGQTVPAKVDTTRYWLEGNKARVEMEDAAIIYDGETETLYGLNDADNSYFEVEKGGLAALMEEKMGPNAGAMAQQMKEMFQISGSVTPTEETKEIGDYTCTKYVQKIDLMGRTVPTEIWTTTDIAVDANLYAIASNAMQAFLPGFDDLMTEFAKIKGVTVESTSEVDYNGVKIKSHSKLISFEDQDVDASLFQIPEGYEETEMQMPGAAGGQGGMGGGR